MASVNDAKSAGKENGEGGLLQPRKKQHKERQPDEETLLKHKYHKHGEL